MTGQSSLGDSAEFQLILQDLSRMSRLERLKIVCYHHWVFPLYCYHILVLLFIVVERSVILHIVAIFLSDSISSMNSIRYWSLTLTEDLICTRKCENIKMRLK